MSRAWSRNTSGDGIADGRYAWGDAALRDGDFAAARELFAQALEQAPHWPPAHYALGQACLAADDHAAARAAFTTVLALDLEDCLGARLLLARLSGVAGGDAMPDGFVRALFDEYAPRFDAHLVEHLGYCAPQRIAAMLARHAIVPETVLDLGCGTGLMAKAMPRKGNWHGVDLSPAMIERARASGLYTRLDVAGLLDWLRERKAQGADLILAADVFCYVPDLAPVFEQAARALRPGGWLAFTVQIHAGAGAVIGADLRVHHAPALVRELARGARLAILDEESASTRRDRGEDVPGALFLLSRGGR